MMRYKLGAVLPVPFAAAVLFSVPATAAAQTESDSLQPGGGGRRLHVSAAARAGSVRLDGRLSDDAWQAATPVSGFVQGEPVEGVTAQEQTEVRVLFDEEAVYVGARLFDREPHRIARQLVRRDERGQYDFFEVAIDPNNDRRTGYSFRVSAAGVQGDAYLFDDVRSDDSWNAVWSSAVQIDSLGWSVEMRIPLSQIRYTDAEGAQSWGINFTRRRVASNERSYLALESRRRHGRVSVFGRLDGIEPGSSRRRVELRPYVLAGTESAPATPGDPFFDGRAQQANAGLDLRYGLGSAFTMDLTVNPDFGQVEVDPAIINLTAYETRFDEKRPFFVEDARIFDFRLSGRENLFYSRRIGREPQGRTPAGALFTDVPDQATILGAAKLTGRTAGGLSVGALAAVTGEETGRAYFENGDSTARFMAEPRTAYGVLRVQQDLNGGATQFGAIGTAIGREMPRGGAFDFLPSGALTGGLDFEHTWARRAWALSGFLAGSRVGGSPAAMVRLQRSSNHYFQRPDARGQSVDTTATSMVGAEWRMQLERRSGKNWTGGVWLGERTPGFEIGELGFSNGTEKLDLGARLSYQEITPGRWLRSYRVGGFAFANWRHEALDDALSWRSWDHALKRAHVNLDAGATLLNYWELGMSGSYSAESLDDTGTRGGPLMLDPASYSLSARLGTDRRKPFRVGGRLSMRGGDSGGWSRSGSMEFTLRPAPSWELQVEPEVSRSFDTGQYVAGIGDAGYAPTFGRRYLFGELDRRSFSVETRLNVTVSPTLTLQLFAQPLLSAGDYTAYKQLLRSESYAFERLAEGTAREVGGRIHCDGGPLCRSGERQYLDLDSDGATDASFREQDFHVRSLRGNAVLRWEYRPGSTLFLVWQQSRYLRDLDAERFGVAAGAGDLLDVAPRDVLLVKASYWLGL